MRLQIRILKPVWNVVENAKSESSIVPCKYLTNLQKFFVFFSFSKIQKRYRRFHFCYYFGVVVNIYEVFFGLFIGLCIVGLCEVAYLRII